MKNLATLACALLYASPVLADAPRIEAVTVTRNGDTHRFDVTLSHPDTGWDHYADAWEVIGPDGTSLGLRTLAHPHVEEQPFTRSLGNVAIPDGVDEVTVRARCLVDGWSGMPMTVSVK